MNKKLLSAILVVCLVMMLLPTVALADVNITTGFEDFMSKVSEFFKSTTWDNMKNSFVNGLRSLIQYVRDNYIWR